MASFIMLFNFTEQGVRNIKESPARVEAARQAFRAMGVTVRDFYATLGRYDTMFIVDAPDDEAAARASLAIASKGNVRVETLRAFSEGEYRKLIAGVP